MVRTPMLTAPMFGLRREIDKLFEDTFGNATTTGTNATVRNAAWMPAVDVKETADAIHFELELPGVAEEKLDITCDGGVLTIAGEKEGLKKEQDGKYHIVERSFGAFRRSFQLPTNVLEDQITARVTNGVLQVQVPKQATPKPRKIEISTK